MVLSGFGLLAFLKIKDEGGPKGFIISGRYFVFLAPIAIVSTTLFVNKFFIAFHRNKWMLINIFITIISLIFIEFLIIYWNLFVFWIYK